MKLRCALVLFLTACVCAFGQSASTILSSLRIKGATSEGGDTKYENYIPRLDKQGLLDPTFIPSSVLSSNIIGELDYRGVEFNTELTMAVSNSLAFAISNQFDRFNWLAYNISTNAVIMAVDAAKEDSDIMEYRNDKSSFYTPVFTNMSSVAFGRGASANYGGWQLGQGTNVVEKTLRFYSTVLVDSRGEVPQDSAGWAVTTNSLNSVSSELSSAISEVSNRISAIETTIPTNLLLRSETKVWKLTITDEGDLKIREYNQ